MPRINLFGASNNFNDEDTSSLKTESITDESGENLENGLSPYIRNQDSERQAQEIKLDFSPTKLEKCFITESHQKKDFENLYERHTKTIQKQKEDVKEQRAKSLESVQYRNGTASLHQRL